MVHINEDPVVCSGRREAIWAFSLWLLAAIYTLGYCYVYGYSLARSISLPLFSGFPIGCFGGSSCRGSLARWSRFTSRIA